MYFFIKWNINVVVFKLQVKKLRVKLNKYWPNTFNSFPVDIKLSTLSNGTDKSYRFYFKTGFILRYEYFFYNLQLMIFRYY